jgi:hypothetical protein
VDRGGPVGVGARVDESGPGHGQEGRGEVRGGGAGRGDQQHGRREERRVGGGHRRRCGRRHGHGEPRPLQARARAAPEVPLLPGAVRHVWVRPCAFSSLLACARIDRSSS